MVYRYADELAIEDGDESRWLPDQPQTKQNQMHADLLDNDLPSSFFPRPVETQQPAMALQQPLPPLQLQSQGLVTQFRQEPYAIQRATTLPVSEQRQPHSNLLPIQTPPLPQENFNSKQIKKGHFRVTEGDNILNFNNMLFLKPEFVSELQQKYRYTNLQCSYIIQYFLQVAMIYPSRNQAIIDEILCLRSDEIVSAGHYQRLHLLDPLRKFANEQPKGVPPPGFVLYQSSVVVAPDDYHFARATTGFQIPDYHSNRQPLPIGVTLHEIVKLYPNHCGYEFLDAFMQHGISAPAIARAIPQDTIDKMKHFGIIKQSVGFMGNRIKARKRTLNNMVSNDAAGLRRLEKYLKSEVKIFELGAPIGAPKGMLAGAFDHMNEFQHIRGVITDKYEEAKQRPVDVQIPRPAQVQSQSAQAPKNTNDRPRQSLPSTFYPKPRPTDAQIKLNNVKAAPKLPVQALPTSCLSYPDSIASSAVPLGHFEDKTFWGNNENQQKFLQDIANWRRKQIQYLDWIVSSDPHATKFDPVMRSKYRSQLVKRLRDATLSTLQQPDVYDPEEKGTISTSPSEICHELNTYLRVLVDKSNLSNASRSIPKARLMQNIKIQAVSNMQTVEVILAQFLGMKVAGIIQGDRMSLLQHQALERQMLEICQLREQSMSSMRAQRLGMATTYQRFASDDPVANALLANIANAAHATVPNDATIHAWLSQVQSEAQARLKTLEAIQISQQPSILNSDLTSLGIWILQRAMNVAMQCEALESRRILPPQSLLKRKRDDFESRGDKARVSKQLRTDQYARNNLLAEASCIPSTRETLKEKSLHESTHRSSGVPASTSYQAADPKQSGSPHVSTPAKPAQKRKSTDREETPSEIGARLMKRPRLDSGYRSMSRDILSSPSMSVVSSPISPPNDSNLASDVSKNTTPELVEEADQVKARTEINNDEEDDDLFGEGNVRDGGEDQLDIYRNDSSDVTNAKPTPPMSIVHTRSSPVQEGLKDQPLKEIGAHTEDEGSGGIEQTVWNGRWSDDELNTLNPELCDLSTDIISAWTAGLVEGADNDDYLRVT